MINIVQALGEVISEEVEKFEKKYPITNFITSSLLLIFFVILGILWLVEGFFRKLKGENNGETN